MNEFRVRTQIEFGSDISGSKANEMICRKPSHVRCSWPRPVNKINLILHAQWKVFNASKLLSPDWWKCCSCHCGSSYAFPTSRNKTMWRAVTSSIILFTWLTWLLSSSFIGQLFRTVDEFVFLYLYRRDMFQWHGQYPTRCFIFLFRFFSSLESVFVFFYWWKSK